MTDPVRIVAVGDSAILVEFDARIDPVINARAIQLAESIRASAIPGVRDVVPTFRSVAVYFDPLRVLYDRLVHSLTMLTSVEPFAAPIDPVPIMVPVRYGGEHGPDLADVARTVGLPEAEVVACHTAATYRVFMIGFVPGFAYMGTVDDRIAVPRHPTPRVKVPAGSVAIAGAQTGIYPLDTPGGWQLIGRTSLRPFSSDRSTPSLFKAGDAVRFYAEDGS